MSTFLEICQKAGAESGVFSDGQPASVVNQTGDLKKLVDWTADAVEWVERQRDDWQWMQKAWSGSLTANNRTYTAAGSFVITDFGGWVIDDIRRRFYPVSIYLTATGVSDETALKLIPYETWLARYDRGTQETNRPTYYTISPAGEIIFAQTPDAAYTARGRYRRKPARPAANATEPGWPAQYHFVAAWEAARRLAEHDEAWNQAKRCERERNAMLYELTRNQTLQPAIRNTKLA
jgi:hypothetical protein